MKFVFKLGHLTSFFNETFDDVEIGVFGRLEALGVM